MYYTRLQILGLFLLIVLLAASCASKDPLSSPPPAGGTPPTGGTPPNDTIWLSSDTVAAGDTAEIILYLTNPDSSIASLNIWLRPSSTGILYDTLSLTIPRFPVTGMEWITGRTDSVNIVSILAFDFQGHVTIPAGSGPLMKIRFAVDIFQPPGSYTLDTSSVLLSPGVSPLLISYASGTSSPAVAYVPGVIVVQ